MQKLTWQERKCRKITEADLGSNPEKDIEEIRLVLRDEQVDGKEQV